eukprot:424210-Amphidinium_carterae.1
MSSNDQCILTQGNSPSELVEPVLQKLAHTGTGRRTGSVVCSFLKQRYIDSLVTLRAANEDICEMFG